MRKLFLLAIMVLFVPYAAHLTVLKASDANVYFESADNYDAYNDGNGKWHVVIVSSI